MRTSAFARAITLLLVVGACGEQKPGASTLDTAGSRPGVVIIVPTPDAPGATVTVDSRPRGAAPLVLRLPAGAHRIAFAQVPGGRAITPPETTVHVRAGQTTSVMLRPDRVAGAR